jgi:hypothetical protein
MIGGAIFGGNTNFGLQAIYGSGGSTSSIATYSFIAGSTDIDCVQAFTLTKVASSFPFRFPDTITITPV